MPRSCAARQELGGAECLRSGQHGIQDIACVHQQLGEMLLIRDIDNDAIDVRRKREIAIERETTRILVNSQQGLSWRSATDRHVNDGIECHARGAWSYDTNGVANGKASLAADGTSPPTRPESIHEAEGEESCSDPAPSRCPSARAGQRLHERLVPCTPNGHVFGHRSA
jgi:hypothetical protein